eukprot:TRINITY_DN13495_c0_g1_i2.p1 TRINITY_DN13495_c0_g1~~TRINITY_DN13495_c0_g1_i2.p1  ORF type:complete len:183 (-),score=16.46 TRINITY_DN13495_c0_g1_i2:391-939(-)
MAFIWRQYTRVLEKYPWRTQILQSGILCATGDAIAQTLVERKKLSDFDPSRSAKFFILGSCVVAPIIRTWYLALDRIVKFPGARGALTKMCMDQGLFAPCFIVIFSTSAFTLNGGQPQNLMSHLKGIYFDILISNWKLWPAAQIINFYFIPLQHRLLVMNLVALMWNTYLAWKTNQTKPTIK